jgi:hypothetical protein
VTLADDVEDYSSGPFCPHWSSLGDCDELCKCSHTCNKHNNSRECCTVDGCICDKFEDVK